MATIQNHSEGPGAGLIPARRPMSGLASLLLVSAWVVGCGDADQAADNSKTSSGGGAPADGAGAAASGSGGAQSGTGGTTAKDTGLIEPDLNEPCEAEEQSEWLSGTHPTIYDGTAVKRGGGLALVRGLKSDAGFDLVLAAPGDQAVEFGPILEFAADTTLVDWSVYASGEGALIVFEDASGRYFQFYSNNEKDRGWKAPVAMVAPLDAGSLALHLFDLEHAYVSSGTGTGMRVHEFDGDSFVDGGEAEYFGRGFRGANNTLVSYRSPTLTDDPHKRIEYTQGAGFGAPEDLPEFLVRESPWAEDHVEYPSGVGVRFVSLWISPETAGLYLHTRRSGAWDGGIRLTEEDVEDYPERFSYAGTDVLFLDDRGENVTIRTGTATGFSAPAALPRSRGVNIVGVAGDVAGGALIAGTQVFLSEDVSSLKLYERTPSGTWLCPVLVPKGTYQSLNGDDGGKYVVTTNDYQSPTTLWMNR